ncbi:hypothetical protein NDU88_003973 [Pleurodeles waltl]|uniref:Uncharacterized protein n=1 Tax=Pleurodeles waltl TaxID=8319 RepID=A0AAV7UGS5_PLEWA|nr:hypothetical protein NDU88_003973 [Pleurodeles waltl]
MEIGASRYIIGGDRNLARDAILDRTGPLDTINNGDRALQSDVMHKNGLVDFWRLTHPGDREYTFLSSVHGTQSRLDYFVISHNLVAYAQDSHILSGGLSHHSTILLVIQLGMVSPSHKPWRFAVQCCRTPQGKAQLQAHTSTYVRDNLG